MWLLRKCKNWPDNPERKSLARNATGMHILWNYLDHFSHFYEAPLQVFPIRLRRSIYWYTNLGLFLSGLQLQLQDAKKSAKNFK